MKHTIEEVVGVTREIDGVVYENAQRANCLLNAANALEKAVEDKKHITLHKAFHAIKDMKIYRKPLVNEGTMGNGKKLEDYSSIAVKFNTKSMYVLTISTYSRLISSGWDETRVELRLSDDLIEEFDKIGELFFSYEGASDVEPEYNPEFGGVEPEVLRRAVRILHQGGDLLAQDRLQLRGVHVLVPGDALLDAADDLHGGLHAHVRRNEHLLEVVQHVGIDRRAARHGARQFREESRLGLFQPGAELLLLFARLLLGGRRILFLFENIEKCHVFAVNFCKDMNKRGQCQIFILNIAEREYLRRSRRYEKVGKFRRSLRSGRIFRLSESAVTAPTPKVNKNV